MITTAQEYNKYLYAIQDVNRPVVALKLPSDEHTYNIDLNARTIETPEFLSVETDHTAETIYFKFSRYYDNIDLSTTTCVIQYLNPKGEGGLYVVPFFDVETLIHDPEDPFGGPKILIPWCIDGKVTEYPGQIQYSVRFFKIDSVTKDLTYNLNTQVAISKVLNGMRVEDEIVSKYTTDELEQALARIAKIEGYIDEDTEEKRFQVYWLNMFNEGAK